MSLMCMIPEVPFCAALCRECDEIWRASVALNGSSAGGVERQLPSADFIDLPAVGAVRAAIAQAYGALPDDDRGTSTPRRWAAPCGVTPAAVDRRQIWPLTTPLTAPNCRRRLVPWRHGPVHSPRPRPPVRGRCRELPRVQRTVEILLLVLLVLDAGFFVPERVFERWGRVERWRVLRRWEVAPYQGGRIGHLLADRVALH